MTRQSPQQPRIDVKTKLELNNLDREFRARRNQVFHNHLARTIRLASPLLIDACTKDELDEAVWRMKPETNWPDGGEPRATVRGWSAKSRRYDRQRMVALNRLTGESFAALDQLALRMTQNTMHMIFRIGSISIVTSGRGGCLSIPRLVDDGHLSELEGATLDRAIALPIITDRPYVILSVVQAPADHSTLIQFEAAPVEWWVPWGRPWEVLF